MSTAKSLRLAFFIFALITLQACATYYQQHLDFNYEFEHGDLQQALNALKGSEAESKSKFLFFANKGLLLSVLGDYEESNAFLEKAFLFGEDYRINYFNEGVSYFTNPNFTVYRGEDHEHLMVLYFKAINYLKMNQPQDALVECRRLNIRLNQLTDKYSSPHKLQRDAFIHTLMGIIYQSTKDYNNAFIAYRNALDVYENEYAKMFHMSIPEQLKKDLVNTAYWTGFMDEFQNYKTKFDMQDYTPVQPDAELVFFWHNGLAPVKTEWGINFVIAPGPGNTMLFTNESMGMVFSFPVEEENDRRGLASLQIYRVMFPRYVERPLYFQTANLEANGGEYPLQLAEDVSKVAFQSLRQRMLQEFAKGLLRAALKKVTEQSLRKKDEGLGALLGMVNAATEKADTRNWQTLPHSIFYSRIPLVPDEKNEVKLKLLPGEGSGTDYSFTYQPQKGRTLFHTFSSLESLAPSYSF
ncbi:MAG TPA: hypothetical protein VIU12_29445 [Chryseolinea sp.]